MGTPLACVVGGLFVAGKCTFTGECGSRVERRFLSLSFAIPIIFLFFSIRRQEIELDGTGLSVTTSNHGFASR